MNHDPTPEKPEEPKNESILLKKPRLVIPAVVFYALLFAVGIVLRYFIQNRWLHLPIYPRRAFELELLVVALGLMFHIAILNWGVRFFKGMSALIEELRSLLGGLTKKECILLAAVSALGEEAFFRGALQPLIGAPLATLLFAAAHVPAGKNMLLWPFYALFMGSFLALLTEISGDIYSAVLLHFLVNAISLLSLNTFNAPDLLQSEIHYK